MLENLTITQVGPDDIDGLIALADLWVEEGTEIFTSGASKYLNPREDTERTVERLADASLLYLVQLNGQSVGFVWSDIDEENHRLWIRSFYVSSPQRGKGIETAIIENQIMDARTRRLGSVYTSLFYKWPQTEEHRALLEELGFDCKKAEIGYKYNYRLK
ncbi:MAG: GNAT family N-acetyltransferase [Candidatus Woesearchaeota archaeon]